MLLCDTGKLSQVLEFPRISFTGFTNNSVKEILFLTWLYRVLEICYLMSVISLYNHVRWAPL